MNTVENGGLAPKIVEVSEVRLWGETRFRPEDELGRHIVAWLKRETFSAADLVMLEGLGVLVALLTPKSWRDVK